jgi:hypothetical protein
VPAAVETEVKFIDSYRRDETTDEDGKMATENDDTKELLLTRLDRVQSRSGEAAMKSTEADGNALQTLGSSPTKTMTGNPVQLAAVQPDIRRRRLVRGAAAVAPMVLTLRSGALAAASCTGAKIISIDSSGQIDPVGLNDTDVCFTDQQVCTGYPLSGPTKIESGTRVGQIAPTYPGGPYACGNLKSTNVAILSSASASSLTA